ncbi:MAG: hypothetical protein ACKVU0_12165 [Saprospiraceae bacterium]
MKNILPMFCLLVWLIGCSKTGPLLNPVEQREVAALPVMLTESSGLEMTPGDIYWSHNDRNGKAELYGFDAFGLLKTTLKITNASNNDWEDIATDSVGNIYIGDFGNNDNDRRDLVIYKIATPLNGQTTVVVPAEKIEFNYPEQTEFPPPEKNWHFDTEAMFAFGGWLYLLTKDRSKPFAGKTRLYRLPDASGNYQAEFLAEFFTDKDKAKGQITAADLSPDGSVLAVLSNRRLYLFKDFFGNDYFSGTLEKSDLPLSRQMEGLVFQDNCTVFLTNEAKPGEPGKLYEVKICN